MKRFTAGVHHGRDCELGHTRRLTPAVLLRQECLGVREAVGQVVGKQVGRKARFVGGEDRALKRLVHVRYLVPLPEAGNRHARDHLLLELRISLGQGLAAWPVDCGAACATESVVEEAGVLR